MKHCIKCKQAFDLSAFYKHPQMADGHLNKCKKCCCEDSMANRDEHLKDPIWVSKERERSRLKAEHYRSIGIDYVSPKSKTVWVAKNPQKTAAQRIARYAMLKGEIQRVDACSECGASGVRLEMHHPDYSLPKFVKWLCTKCHGITRRLPRIHEISL